MKNGVKNGMDSLKQNDGVVMVREEEARQAYSPPMLQVYGLLRDVTTGGSSGRAETGNPSAPGQQQFRL